MTSSDYLVIGGGAMGMAFTDVLLAETDATITIVERRAKPGGHWNDAYPFVRLHQPSAFYGVNSQPLGSDRIDDLGWNEGLYELASGAEVVTYFDHVLNHHFLPSGRVRFVPMTDYLGDGRLRSLVSGAETGVEATKVVDATYMNVSVPATTPPSYEIGDGVICRPVNELVTAEAPSGGYVIIGAGKTGADACLFLLANGADPDDITWIMPRDSWYLDRADIQPGTMSERSLGRFLATTRAIAESTSIADLFDRLEGAGHLLRLDAAVEPTMYRCSTVTTAELDQLRRIDRIVRLGRVVAIEADRLVLEDGEIPTSTDTFHVDCSADGLARLPSTPVFAGDRITLQTVRHCQQVFSAALIGRVEASGRVDDAKNGLCAVVPHPDSATDWIRAWVGSTTNLVTWRMDAEIQAWLDAARLNGFSRSGPVSDELRAVLPDAGTLTLAALEKANDYVAELDAEAEPG